MVVIPLAPFTMGVPRGEEERFGVVEASRGRSEPMTQISFRHRFAIGKFEVTRGEFAAFVKETGYQLPDHKGCWNTYGRYSVPTDDARRAIGRNQVIPEATWISPGFEQDDSHPVVCLSWADIRAYLSWLSRKSGHIYRLPSEAEWEYTARAGSNMSHPWGDENDEACKHGNVSDMSRVPLGIDPAPDNIFQCNDGFPFTAPVGSFPPNSFGVHDMIGNVWEVTEDCFAYDLEDIPRDGTPRIADVCIHHPVRGGSFDIFPWFVRSGYRSRYDIPGNPRFSYEGFRVARTID